MQKVAGRDRRIAKTVSRWTLAAGFVLATDACQATPESAGAPYLLTATGGYVRSNAPPGVEVFLGSKQVRPAGAPTGLAPTGLAPNDLIEPSTDR
jgi:hypothetical protein